MAGFRLADLFRAPDVNPISRKAQSIPALNPVNVYGRVFFFSWFGFTVAFWAWYAFPPLVSGRRCEAEMKQNPPSRPCPVAYSGHS